MIWKSAGSDLNQFLLSSWGHTIKSFYTFFFFTVVLRRVTSTLSLSTQGPLKINSGNSIHQVLLEGTLESDFKSTCRQSRSPLSASILIHTLQKQVFKHSEYSFLSLKISLKWNINGVCSSILHFVSLILSTGCPYFMSIKKFTYYG